MSMHQDFLLTESVVPVIISINRKNRKEILRKKEIRLKKLGIIGYGLRSETMMKAFQGIQAPVQVAAVADPLWCQKQEAFAQTAEFAQTVFYETAEEMLEKERLDGVLIGTRCNQHTKYAELVFQKKIPLFLEKPVCINEEQYQRLLHASEGMRGQTVVSFPLRFTCIVKEMKKLVDSGELGEVLSVQATNHVPYGSVYYHSWYRDDSLTGGLFLQKSTHDMDYITYILGKRPVSVVAKSAKMYFKGEKEAGLCCEDCSEYHTCPESSFVVKTERKEEPTGKYCCFAKDTGNEDVGAAIFTCEDGTIISYHQTFFVKNNAGRRGARFIGSKASAEFDFYTATLRVDYYDTKHSAEHRFTYPEGLVHFGGDEQLAKAYVDVLEGKDSRSDLCAGLASAAACLAAKKAAENGKEEHIFYGF